MGIQELDIRAHMNIVLEDVFGRVQLSPDVPDLQGEVMPGLIGDAVGRLKNKRDRDRLRLAKSFINYRKIAVGYRDGDCLEGLDKDIVVEKFPIDADFFVAIVINSTLASTVSTLDDRDMAVKRLSKVLITAHDYVQELSANGNLVDIDDFRGSQ